MVIIFLVRVDQNCLARDRHIYRFDIGFVDVIAPHRDVHHQETKGCYDNSFCVSSHRKAN